MTVNDGATSVQELFALTDEQILGIDGAGDEGADPSELKPLASGEAHGTQNGRSGQSAINAKEKLPATLSLSGQALRNSGQAEGGRYTTEVPSNSGPSARDAQPGMPLEARGKPALPEAPGWLKERMTDPWHGDEARELWESTQKARIETGAYREVFATPEDARALKELYPGGVGEAKTAAERARQLGEIDAAYFGEAGSRPEELSAGRVQLAQRLMAQDPVAFREMVMAGVRLLEGGRENSNGSRGAAGSPRSFDPGEARGTQNARSEPQAENRNGQQESRSLAGARDDSNTSHNFSVEKMAAEYGSFETAANAELERSVGGAIARTMEQALPNLGRMAGEKSGAAFGERLKASVRDEVDAALKSDAQLSEQLGKILAGRRFDEGTRSQVVRLIDARAQQLVPGAVRRVVGNWTQTAMAARRGEAVPRRETRVQEEQPEKKIPRVARNDSPRQAIGRVNYGKLSDEEILEL